MNDTAEVWRAGEFLGRVAITADDWRNGVGNWRSASLTAARRVFGPGAYHVAAKSHLMGEKL